jgi:4a-hydroxytetrahydrobiopterin dehydratase
MATLLNAEAVARLLDEVPRWRLSGDSIERTVKCKDFTAAIHFVNGVAAEAEAMNHHPDIDIRWNTVRLVLTTHSAEGLTDLDFTLARKLDAVAQEVGAGTSGSDRQRPGTEKLPDARLKRLV